MVMKVDWVDTVGNIASSLGICHSLVAIFLLFQLHSFQIQRNIIVVLKLSLELLVVFKHFVCPLKWFLLPFKKTKSTTLMISCPNQIDMVDDPCWHWYWCECMLFENSPSQDN
jgi:hypothetical protein